MTERACQVRVTATTYAQTDPENHPKIVDIGLRERWPKTSHLAGLERRLSRQYEDIYALPARVDISIEEVPAERPASAGAVGTENVFQIRIHLGGATMMNGGDVGPALRKVAAQVESWGKIVRQLPQHPIMDEHGNQVGIWTVVEEEYIA